MFISVPHWMVLVRSLFVLHSNVGSGPVRFFATDVVFRILGFSKWTLPVDVANADPNLAVKCVPSLLTSHFWSCLLCVRIDKYFCLLFVLRTNGFIRTCFCMFIVVSHSIESGRSLFDLHRNGFMWTSQCSFISVSHSIDLVVYCLFYTEIGFSQLVILYSS